jgi:hypothetical protein
MIHFSYRARFNFNFTLALSKMEKIFIQLLTLLICLSNGSQAWNFNSVESIISYPHYVITVSDAVPLLNYLSSFYSTSRELPVEFRGRFLILLYHYKDSELHKEYFKNKYENQTLTIFLDYAEMYYRMFFEWKPYHDELWRLSPKDLILAARHFDINGRNVPEYMKTTHDLSQSIIFLRERITGKGLPTERKYALSKFLDKIVKDIVSRHCLQTINLRKIFTLPF